MNKRDYLLKQNLGLAIRLMMAVLFMPLFTLAQTTVSGKVTKDNGEPLPNVSVVVKGTTQGTATDADGNFTIKAASGAVLIFSAVDYEDQQATVGQSATINVVLKHKDTQLSEVVVVGYGTQRKRDVTGSVASVNEKALREVPAANLQQALQGRAAGLEIQRTGTQPGAGAQIRIRGERSINGSNDPLIILDGIPFEGGNLNDINPADVLSVDVLKDASATAIYGSRGSNGVVLVTTKKGKAGETRVNYNGYYGINNVTRRYSMMNTEEYMAMRNLSNWTLGYDAIEKANMTKGVDTDWQDLMYENGFITDQNISVSGGAGGSTFSLGAGYFDEKSVLPGQDFKRFSIRATIDAKIGKRLKVGLNSMNTLNYANGSQFVYPMWNILAASPLMTPYDSVGNLILSPYGNPDDKAMNYNPVLLKNNNNNWVDRVRRLRTFNSLYGEVQIATGLKYRLNAGLDFRLQENDQFRSADTKLKPSYFRPGKGNTASVNNSEGYGYTLENIITYEKEIANKHRFLVTGLYSVQEDFYHNTYVSKDSIDEDFIQFYNLGQANASNSVKPIVSGGESSWGLISYMLRLNYSFSDKYLLTLTGRIDGSSRLAEGNKYHQYPAVSAGWIISNEDFMDNQSLFNSLKLRIGWGETSNQSISPYSSLGNIGPYNDIVGSGTPGGVIRYNYGPSIVTGYTVLNLPNNTLDWEYTRTTNIGLDFGLLKNRISGSIEYYNAFTHKILYGISLPPTSGITRSFITNIGEMENKGLELNITTQNINNINGFSWSTDLNLFFNRNKLLKLTDGFTQNISSQLFIGHPLSALYDFTKLGIWQKEEAEEAAKYGRVPGDIKLKDISGPDGKPDGVISENYDRSVIGSGQADWQGGMTNRFNYKGFDLSVVMYARMGGLLVSQAHQPYAAYINVLDGKRNNLKVDYWTPNNPSNDFPNPALISSSAQGLSTLGYFDASFIKVRSINLGYTFSNTVLSKLNAQSIRVYLSAQNPFVLYSPYMRKGGVDPEPTGLGNQGVSNPGNLSGRALTIGLATPPTRSIIVGLNISL